jgi:hypothetical protein
MKGTVPLAIYMRLESEAQADLQTVREHLMAAAPSINRWHNSHVAIACIHLAAKYIRGENARGKEAEHASQIPHHHSSGAGTGAGEGGGESE